MDYFNLKFEKDKLTFIDQTKLPLVEEYVTTDKYERIAVAIERLEIRGAPAIGIAAGYALALSVKNSNENFFIAYERLRQTRPTAVNLFYVLDRMKFFFETDNNNQNYPSLLNLAIEIHNTDIRQCEMIAKNGAELFKSKTKILTHCNTGMLATGGIGTAFGIILELHKQKKLEFVYACESRPLFQGLRLTSYELAKNKIPNKIITDSTAAYLMQKKLIDAVIVGADRIVRNGDTANKIGTYSLAINAAYHKIPFYVAAPISTIDNNYQSGEMIRIEERAKEEITRINENYISSPDIEVFNPAFDVTPAKLITAIISDRRVYFPPYKFT
ncbi:MAG: S-methyl-5-thioribose-1-phosphate isomerase [Bacteroidetes bacterium]|nr:S-methyl-5-thioribose-1-phosphate isomerase [Bacteroidota bacterium]MBU2585768.1 S-methyl-5-thioribose-1-phosphate isomerase [Bacteroidota bacterium]